MRIIRHLPDALWIKEEGGVSEELALYLVRQFEPQIYLRIGYYADQPAKVE